MIETKSYRWGIIEEPEMITLRVKVKIHESDSQNIQKSLNDILGVESCDVGSHAIYVYKSPIFEWKYIIPTIECVMQVYFS